MDTNASYLLRWRGRQHGPFTLPQIERKLTENEIGMLHEIQVEGEWVTLRVVFEQMQAGRRAEAERAATASARVSVQMGAPKQQPARPRFQDSPDSSVSEGDYVLDMGSCISRAWNLVAQNLGVTLVSAFLFALVSALPLGLIQLYNILVLPALMTVSPFIYFATWVVFTTLSLIVYAVIWGPFYGGLAYTYIGLARGEARSIGDLFAGFRRKMGHAMLGWLVPNFFSSLAAVLGLVPFVVLAVAAGLGAQAMQSNAASAVSALNGLWLVLMAAYFLFLYLPMLVLLSARWFYVVPLVIDRQMGFWPAMGLSWRQVGQHPWKFLGLWIVAGFIGGMGMLLCGVGLLFTLPLYEMIMMVAYTAIFSLQIDHEQSTN